MAHFGVAVDESGRLPLVVRTRLAAEVKDPSTEVGQALYSEIPEQVQAAVQADPTVIDAAVSKMAELTSGQLLEPYAKSADVAGTYLPKTDAYARLTPVESTPLTVVLGDSHTDQNHVALPSGQRQDFDSYHFWASAFLDGRMRVISNAGIAGQTSTQILARVSADVIAKLPNGGTCLILWGTNDAGNGGQSTADMITTFKANTRALVAALRAARITPIFVTIPPRGNSTTASSALEKEKTATVNRWVVAYCASVGVRCVDTRGVITNPATGNWTDNYSDVIGIHALPRANVLLGRYVAAELDEYFPPTRPYQAASNVDPTNSITNGLFLNVTGSLPTGWSVVDTGAGLVTTVGATAGMRGNGFKLTGTAPADQAIINSPALSGISIGDRLAVSFRYIAAGLQDVGRYFDLGLRQNGGSYSWLARLNVEGDTPAGIAPLVYFEATVLTGTTNVVFQIGTGQSGTSGATAPAATFGELTIVNLTTGQLVTP